MKHNKFLRCVVMIAIVIGMIYGTVSSAYAVSVSYLDADGNTQTADATELTGGSTTISEGWYVVNSNVTISARIGISGTVNLILVDGYTLTASAGITTTGATLNIYGQSGGTGTLSATSGSDNAGIGGGSGGAGGTVTINGGTVTATGGSGGAGIGGGTAGSGGTVTINGGTVTANGGNGSAGIGGGANDDGGTVTINGGTVTATGGDAAVGIGGGANGSNGTLNLGSSVVLQTSTNNSDWTTTTDASTRTRYMKTETVTSYSYLDENGDEQSTTAAALTSGSTTLSEGWYVVNSDLTISSRITISGTVNLILVDGCTLTASAGITTTGAALNIYGQSGGTGALTISGVAPYDAGIGGLDGHAGGTVTINGGTITVTGGYCGAGIGGGTTGSGGTITINGGTVTAVGSTTNGAGIGGGSGGAGGTITINGGTVTATGGSNGMGIGCGRYASNNGTLTLGFGVVLQTSTNNSEWTTTTDTSTRTQYMKTSVSEMYRITIPSTLTVSNSGWNALDGGISVDSTLADGKTIRVTASSDSGFNFVNTSSSDQKIAYYFLEGGDSTTTYNADSAQTSWSFTESGSKDIGIMVEDYSEKPVGTYKETVMFTTECVKETTLADAFQSGSVVQVTATNNAGSLAYIVQGTFNGTTFEDVTHSGIMTDFISTATLTKNGDNLVMYINCTVATYGNITITFDTLNNTYTLSSTGWTAAAPSKFQSIVINGDNVTVTQADS